VYVADTHYFKSDKGFPDATTRVIKLAAGSNSQTVLPQFVHAGLVADPAGAVWVVDARNEQLVKLAAGSDTQTVLPLPNLGVHGDIQTVDNAGNVYGANGGGVDSGGGCCVPVHVVKLAVGSNNSTVLPFAHINGDGGMAVDTAGNVYVGDYNNNRVLELAAGSDTPTVLPFTHLHGVIDIAVDAAGGVYVVDAEHNRVMKLTAGSDTPTVLPFSGLITLSAWRWTPRAMCTSSTAATTGCSNLRRSSRNGDSDRVDRAHECGRHRRHPEWDPIARPRIPRSLLEIYDHNVDARRRLTAMSKGYEQPTLPAWRIDPPPPADELLGYYSAVGCTLTGSTSSRPVAMRPNGIGSAANCWATTAAPDGANAFCPYSPTIFDATAAPTPLKLIRLPPSPPLAGADESTPTRAEIAFASDITSSSTRICLQRAVDVLGLGDDGIENRLLFGRHGPVLGVGLRGDLTRPVQIASKRTDLFSKCFST
jgi:hypothetical protein